MLQAKAKPIRVNGIRKISRLHVIAVILVLLGRPG
jgi:hypothetical protein